MCLCVVIVVAAVVVAVVDHVSLVSVAAVFSSFSLFLSAPWFLLMSLILFGPGHELNSRNQLI